MNSLVIAFAAMLAVANAGLHGLAYVGAADHGVVLQGPGAHASVVGPDGSVITQNEHGGAIVADGHHGGAIVASAHHGYAAPVYAHHAAHVVAAPVAYHGLGYAAHEGQYVPSGLENLYDDGSYRGEHHYAGHYGHYY